MEALNLYELKICRNLREDPVLQKIAAMLTPPTPKNIGYELTAELIDQAELHGLSGNLIQQYAAYLMTQGNNTASWVTECCGGEIGASLRQAFRDDMEILARIMNLVPGELLSTALLNAYEPTQQSTLTSFVFLKNHLIAPLDADRLTDLFLNYYRTYGCGDIASHHAFRWDEERRLVGICHFDPSTLDHLIGYQRQKEMLLGNTEAFVAGRPANNVLLVGARGTGKSSSVKALANLYFDRGLRLLEITKQQLLCLPKIMETLRRIGSKKFIIFLDDLSFEDFEPEYKYLKSAIEGGVESKPSNVLIYATSNRRHLIKETWRDRGESSDELHRNDSINETISLSDRFGLTIHYLAPTQDEYQKIIAGLLQQEGVSLDGEELRVQSLRWEMTHSGRSGRTARQFITNYLGGR